MEAWNNPEAGMHPLPDDPREVTAALRAGERCMRQFPYLGIRFGARGDAFARTDSGFLATLVRDRQDYVTDQAKWLARVLSSRGMPRWLMEVHLDILAEELDAAKPGGRHGYDKLRQAGRVLRGEREAVIAPQDFDRLSASFQLESGGLIGSFGGLVVSAVCDESIGIGQAVPALVDWTQEQSQLPPAWRAAVIGLVGTARQLAGQVGTRGAAA